MSFTKEEIDEFKAEAFEILDGAEKKLFAIEAGGDFKDSFDAVFRGFHNLKGASGMMELMQLQSHVHELETILMQFKEKESMPKSYVSFFLKGIDGARAILEGNEIQFDYQVAASEDRVVENIAEKVEESIAVKAVEETVEKALEKTEAPLASFPAVDLSAINEFIAEGEEIIERISGLIRVIESNQHDKETLNNIYRDIHSLKGSSYLFGYSQIGDIAHAMESSMDLVREGTHIPSKELIDIVYQAILYIEGEFSLIKINQESNSTNETGKNLVKAFEAAMNNLKPITENISAKVELKAEENVSAKIEEKVVEKKIEEKKTPAPTTEAVAEKDDSGGSIRVPVALLDNLMTLMGEMVLVRNQVLQFSNESEDLNFLNLSKRLNVVTSEIQGEMMKTRMQPIGNILSKYHRVVRDLSQELSKSISLNLNGAETELDKSLLESIKDPLTHIVRNSCDHGIETPDVRRAAGKADAGTINIRSYHEGGQVVIEVSDDGKGLHKDALIKKALEKGLITQSQVSSMSEKEIFNLIFAPGFSTAAVVTNVSGRGVGMDVVRTNIEKMGGTVELHSVAGKGTTTKINIPLTLAIIPALIVKSGNETFAIPQVKLEELVRVEQSSIENKIEYLHGTPVYRLRGNILPLVDLNKVLGVKNKENNADSVFNIAVLGTDQCVFGLIVDEIQDTADIVVKPLNRLLKSLQVYSGATILGDGSIALILDIQGISKVAHVGGGKETMNSQRAEQKRTSDFQEYILVGLNSPTKHAIVLGYVNRLEEFKASSIELSGNSRVVRYGKTILPIISVSEMLGYGVSKEAREKLTINVVVVQKAGVLYGLEVDEIVDTLSTDADVDSSIVKQAGFFGNLNTADGLIVAIDPFELISLAYPEKVVQIYSGTTPQGTITRLNKRELKILFAEDTVFFRKAVSIILQKEGHNVTIAVDGQDALDILKQNPDKFDLVISDIEMPRMNGFELATAVRANEKLCMIPMLALSSRADKKFSDQGIKAGFNRYLEKLKPAILLEAISQLSDPESKSA